jgi:hypothetical protein
VFERRARGYLGQEWVGDYDYDYDYDYDNDNDKGKGKGNEKAFSTSSNTSSSPLQPLMTFDPEKLGYVLVEWALRKVVEFDTFQLWTADRLWFLAGRTWSKRGRKNA